VLPIEAAFEQQRAARIAGALVVRFEFPFQPVELRIGERRPADDERAGGPRRVVEECLVPGARRVVDIERRGGGFHGGQAVMVVRRMEQRQMQDRRQRLVLADGKAHGLRADRIFVSGGPAVRIRHHAHAVGAQRMEFVRRAIEAHRLHIGIARHHEVPVEALEKALPALPRIGPRQQCQQRMRAKLAPLARQHQRQGGGRLAHQAYGAVHDGVLLEAFAGKRRVVARRPHGATGDIERDRALSARSLRLGRGLKPAGQSVQHE
jgi:hypothetical protein